MQQALLCVRLQRLLTIDGSDRVSWGSRENKFAILGGLGAPSIGAKTQEYLDMPNFRNAPRKGCTGVPNVTLISREPLVWIQREEAFRI